MAYRQIEVPYTQKRITRLPRKTRHYEPTGQTLEKNIKKNMAKSKSWFGLSSVTIRTTRRIRIPSIIVTSQKLFKLAWRPSSEKTETLMFPYWLIFSG
jgi:hypothetical protein